MPTKTQRNKPPKIQGLASFVAEITPHINPNNKTVTRRGAFTCERGHKFTATLTDMKAGEHKLCQQCAQGSASIATLLKAKTRLSAIERFTAAPTLSMSLTKMVDQQNNRVEAAAIGRLLEKTPLGKVGAVAKKVQAAYHNATPSLQKTLDPILEVLGQIDDLVKAGAMDEADQVKTELQTTLQAGKE